MSSATTTMMITGANIHCHGQSMTPAMRMSTIPKYNHLKNVMPPSTSMVVVLVFSLFRTLDLHFLELGRQFFEHLEAAFV